MKIAYLVWDSREDREAGEQPKFTTEEPDRWLHWVQIVYAEVLP